MWGTLAGSMLPFVLRRWASTRRAPRRPFVATLVDVTGLIIYFTVAERDPARHAALSVAHCGDAVRATDPPTRHFISAVARLLIAAPVRVY